MQIENIKISPAEVNNFPTALKWRRHAFGMDYEDVAELVGGGYTSLQVYNWEAGMSLPSDEEKATILATLAYVQSEILAAYEKYIHDITALRFPAPTVLLCPTTQEDYETIYSEMAEKLPLAAYRRLLKMLHMRLGLPVVTMNAATEQEEIFS
jgi:hypothetical protein